MHKFILTFKVIISVLIAMVFFLELVNLLQFTKIGKSLQVAQKSMFNIQKETQTVDQKLSLMLGKQKLSIDKTLEEHFEIEPKDNTGITHPSQKRGIADKIMDRYIFFDYILHNNNKVVPAFYLLMLFTFLYQVTLLVFSGSYEILRGSMSEKKLDAIFLYGSEWAVNTPTVLGVMGTIFSFGMTVYNLSDMSSLSTVFKDNFANAALTTIIGGSVYALNLFINIMIAKNLTIGEGGAS